MWKKIFLGLLAAAALLVVVVVAVGYLLPEEHVASVTAEIGRPPEEVWAVLTDFAAHPAWREDLKQVERLPERAGLAVWREESGFGPLAYEVDELEPPRRFVTRIADPDLPFSGTWTYEIVPAGGGCRVTITERGRIPNPLFRFVSRFVMGHTATMEQYLGFLERHFGEDGTVQPAG
jgi:uncharacterized protein YndB with AHSA1/START domain